MSVAAAFETSFGRTASGLWSGPGRVNLIGDHTDYNDGFVLPFAIDRRATVAVRLRDDGRIRCVSRQRPHETVEADVRRLTDAQRGWAAYVIGIVWALAESGLHVEGFDLLLDSDVPVGAGLSSSAAVEMATALALCDLLGLDLAAKDLALLCHRAETQFVGAPVGVMDQFVSACATAGHALLLDCRTLEITHVPFDPSALGCAVLVVDTGAAHVNTDGGYAERRRECEDVAAVLGLRALRDAAAEQVTDHPRARHVVAECTRVLSAVDALRAQDPGALGELMLASHASLRDDFAVSSPALDVAVEAAMSAGAHGARLTGAGFGGCAIALVPLELAGVVTDAVTRAFASRGHRPPDVFRVCAGPGVSRVA